MTSTKPLTRGQEYYRKNRERLRVYQRERYRNDPEFVAQRRAYCREYTRKNRERLTEAARQRRQGSPRKYLRIARRAEQRRRSTREGFAKVLMYAARTRAKAHKMKLNITPADILAVWPKNDRCPVFNTPFFNTPYDAQRKPSLDRLDSRRGYVQGNLAVISWRANNLKSDAVTAEVERLLKWMRKNNI